MSYVMPPLAPEDNDVTISDNVEFETVLVEFKLARTRKWTEYKWMTPLAARNFTAGRSSKFWRVFSGPTTLSPVTIWDEE